MENFAFAGSVPQGYVGNSSERKSPLDSLLKQDRARPANCFRIGWEGKIEEGIFLDIDHPAVRGKTALIFGETGRFIASNTNRDHGCLFEYVGARALMRRAVVDTIHIVDKGDFPILSRTSGVPDYALAHIDFGTPTWVKPKTVLWAGIRSYKQAVAWGGSEALLRVEDGFGSTRIFYADGRVGFLNYEMFGSASSIKFLAKPEDVLVARLDLVEHKLAETDDIHDADRKVRAVDKWFHELANMLSLGGNSDLMRRQIMNVAERLSVKYSPSSGPRMKFKNILWEFGDRTIYGWLFGKTPTVVDVTPLVQHFAREKVSTKPTLTRQQIEAKKKANRDARHAAQPQRGTSSGGGQKQGKQKGGKKN